MFSGKKFRFWSRQSSSKKDTEKEPPPKNKNKSNSPAKNTNEILRPPTTSKLQENPQPPIHQKPQDDYARLEETVKELTAYKTQVGVLEKKFVSAAKSFERKELRYTDAISALESENEHLRQEIKRLQSACGNCYFCCRQNRFAVHPETGKVQEIRNIEESSSESLQSSESWKRLERLEEKHTAIVRETSKQKEETSKCLERLSKEVVKTSISQKALRRDCTQLQDRLQQLEKQNNQLNRVIFRQYTPSSSPSSSQTHYSTVKRSEVAQSLQECSPNLSWDKTPTPKVSPLESPLNADSAQSAQQLFRAPPPPDRFSQKFYGTITNYGAIDDIPKLTPAKKTPKSTAATNHNECQQVESLTPFQHRVSLAKTEKTSPKGDFSFVLDTKQHNKIENLESGTNPAVVLRDELEEILNDSSNGERKPTFGRGSTFSLNDILDGNIDELQLSIQNSESSRNNNETRSGEKSKLFATPCSTSVGTQSKLTVGSRGFGLAKSNNSAEKQHRFSYPVVSHLKSDKHLHQETVADVAVITTEDDSKETCDTATDVRHVEHIRERFRLCSFDSDTDAKEIKDIVFRDTTEFEDKKPRPVSDVESLQEGYKTSPGPAKTSSTSDYTASEEENVIQDGVKNSSSLSDSFLQQLISETEKTPDGSVFEANRSQDGAPDQNPLPATTTDDTNSCHASDSQETDLVDEEEEQEEQEEKEQEAEVGNEVKRQDTDDPSSCKIQQEVNWQFGKESEEFGKESKEKTSKFDDSFCRRLEHFDSLTSETVPNDSDSEIVMSKEKVTALTAYFEDVHTEHCPDCQTSGTKCKISSAQKHFKLSKESQSTDDDLSGANCENVPSYDQPQEVLDTEQQESTTKQTQSERRSDDEADEDDDEEEDDDYEDIWQLISHESPERYQSGVATIQKKPTANETSVAEGNVQITDLENILEEVTAFLLGKSSTSPRDITDECTFREGNKQLDTKSAGDHQPPELRLQDSQNKSLEERITDQPLLDLPVDTPKPLTTRWNPTRNRTLWNSMPSYLPSTKCLSPVLQVNYVRAHSLKSFSDITTPPSTPRLPIQGSSTLYENVKTYPEGFAHIQKDDQLQDQPSTMQDVTVQHDRFQIGFTSENLEEVMDSIGQKPYVRPQNLMQYPATSPFSKNYKHRDASIFGDNRVRNESEVFSEGLQQTSPNAVKTLEQQKECEPLHQEKFIKSLESCSQRQSYSYANPDTQELDPDALMQTDTIFPFWPVKFPHNEHQNDKGEHTKSQYDLCDIESRDDDALGEAFPDLLSDSHAIRWPQKPLKCYDSGRQGNTLTEADIRKYQLDNQGHKWRAGTRSQHQPILPRTVFPQEEIQDNISLQLLSSKPPIPPPRFHISRYCAPDGNEPLIDYPDYEEIDQTVLMHPTVHQNESQYLGGNFADEAHDLRRHVDVLKDAWNPHSKTNSSVSNVRRHPIHTPVAHPVQFRDYSRSLDAGKRNTYPSGRIGSDLVLEQRWQQTGIEENLTQHHPSGTEKNINSSDRVFAPNTERLASRHKPVHRQRSCIERIQTNPQDVENDLVFYEITKQIENLRQTVSEMQKSTSDC